MSDPLTTVATTTAPAPTLAADQAPGALWEPLRGALFDVATQHAPHELPYRNELERSFGCALPRVPVALGRPEIAAGGLRAGFDGHRLAFASAHPSRDEVFHEAAHLLQHARFGAGAGSRDAAEQDADRVVADVKAGRPAQVSARTGAGVHGWDTREHFQGYRDAAANLRNKGNKDQIRLANLADSVKGNDGNPLSQMVITTATDVELTPAHIAALMGDYYAVKGEDGHIDPVKSMDALMGADPIELQTLVTAIDGLKAGETLSEEDAEVITSETMKRQLDPNYIKDHPGVVQRKESYLDIARWNSDHFLTNPSGPNGGKPTAYDSFHLLAMQEAQKLAALPLTSSEERFKLEKKMMAYEGAASHFLMDYHSGGHQFDKDELLADTYGEGIIGNIAAMKGHDVLGHDDGDHHFDDPGSLHKRVSTSTSILASQLELYRAMGADIPADTPNVHDTLPKFDPDSQALAENAATDWGLSDLGIVKRAGAPLLNRAYAWDRKWTRAENFVSGKLDGFEGWARDFWESGLDQQQASNEAVATGGNALFDWLGGKVNEVGTSLGNTVSSQAEHTDKPWLQKMLKGGGSIIAGIGGLGDGSLDLAGDAFQAGTRGLSWLERQTFGLASGIVSEVWGAGRTVGELVETGVENQVNPVGMVENLQSGVETAKALGSYASMAAGAGVFGPIAQIPTLLGGPKQLQQAQTDFAATTLGAIDSLTGNDFSEGRYGEGITQTLLSVVNPLKWLKLPKAIDTLSNVAGAVQTTEAIQDAVNQVRSQ